MKAMKARVKLMEKLKMGCNSKTPDKDKLLQWKNELCRQRDCILELGSKILEVIVIVEDYRQ